MPINFDIKDLEKPGKTHNALSSTWQFIRDVLGGTDRMRACGEKYLPKHPAESDINYANRRNNATFTPFYKLSTNNMVGRIFAKEPAVTGAEKDDQFSSWLENVDLMGNCFSVFLQEVFQKAMDYGLTYVFVDYTKGKNTATMAEEKASGARPYLVHVKPWDVLSVDYASDGTTLARVRIKECIENDSGEDKERIRVVEPGYFWLFEEVESQDDKDDYILIDEGVMTLPVIPLVPFFTSKEDGLRSKPPLLEVAYLNVKYYQFESNHDNALTVAQFPMLAATGLGDDDAAIQIGPKKLLRAVDPAARFFFVEHSGAAIEAGRKRLEDIKADMAVQGMKMLSPSIQATKTATEVSVDEESSTSTLQVIAKRGEDAAENALQFMAAWVNKSLEIEVETRGSYDFIASDVQVFAQLVNLATNGRLTNATLWKEAKRRNILADDFDGTEEQKILDTSSPM